MHIEKHAFILCLMVAALALIGCEGKEGAQGPAGPVLAYILGNATSYVDEPEQGTASVQVLNTKTVPVVAINGVSLSANGMGIWFWADDFDISPGQAANLAVNFTNLAGEAGTAAASVTLPGPFELLDPTPPINEPIVIALGSAFDASWSAAAGADAYDVYFSLYYYYQDLTGNDTSFSFDLDTLLDATSISFTAAQLFPDLAQIADLNYGGGWFGVDAVQGPWGEGAPGNVTGDGAGFFYGWTRGWDYNINVSETSYVAAAKPTFPERMQAFLDKKAAELGLK